MTASPFEIADALDALADRLTDLAEQEDIAPGARETVRDSDSQIVGWIDNDRGCENERCVREVLAGRRYHAIPQGGRTLDRYHFGTAAAARAALLRDELQGLFAGVAPACFSLDIDGGDVLVAARNIRGAAARIRQAADDEQRRVEEGDEQRDYAEERANRELLRDEAPDPAAKYVNVAALEAMSVPELREVVESGGPAALVDAALNILAARPEQTPGVGIFTVGARVFTVALVDRYPHFLIPSGKTGTVTEAYDGLIRVRMDEHVPGAEEWDNEVVWDPQDEPDRGERDFALVDWDVTRSHLYKTEVLVGTIRDALPDAAVEATDALAELAARAGEEV